MTDPVVPPPKAERQTWTGKEQLSTNRNPAPAVVPLPEQHHERCDFKNSISGLVTWPCDRPALANGRCVVHQPPPPTLLDQLLALPQGVYIGANRYDTDDTHTLHLWNAQGESFDVIARKRDA